jgi:hypothetical protein
MANYTGFTYGQIVDHIVTYIGNESTEFKNYVRQLIVMAEMRYYKLHDWSFLHKTGLSLNTALNTNEYLLNASTIGYFMAASDVESIRAENDNFFLRKLDLNQLRRLDSDANDGNSNEVPRYWAVAGDNKISIWPTKTKITTLKLDGKITPVLKAPINNETEFDASSPEIPLRYQEAFIEYVKAQALDRENDDRAASKKQEAMLLIRQDIQSDMLNIGDAENPRIKSPFEIYEISPEPRAFPASSSNNTTSITARLGLVGLVTVTSADYYLGCDTSAGVVTLSLPAAAAVGAGKKYIIKDEAGNASVNNITVDPDGSELIDLSATYVMNVNYESITIVSNGTSWNIV